MQNQSTMERVDGKKMGVAQWSGLSLVLLGGALFASSVLGFRLENWWALFILMPALALFGGGWLFPRNENGHFEHAQ